MDNKARIYAPAKSAMQMGRRQTQQWILEFISSACSYREPTMNWIGMRDTQTQVRLFFSSQVEACRYAQAHNLNYEIIVSPVPLVKAKSYACNFE